MDDFENINVEDLVNGNPVKKKKNGCRKGKTIERQLCKILTDHFKVSFTRSIGSGNSNLVFKSRNPTTNTRSRF